MYIIERIVDKYFVEISIYENSTVHFLMHAAVTKCFAQNGHKDCCHPAMAKLV